MPEPLVVLGGGEHAFVVCDAALSRPDLFTLVGVADPSPCEDLTRTFGIAWLGDDDAAMRTLAAETRIVLGVGAPRRVREVIVARWAAHASRWATVVHSRAEVSRFASLGEGVVVLACAVVNACASVGEHAIINSGAVVEHHASVGRFAHVAPRAVIGGGARVGAGAHVGLGASVRDHVEVGDRVTIGMGAAVVSKVAADETVVGVPARSLPGG